MEKVDQKFNQPPETRFVVYGEDHGVFLGIGMGMGFFSKTDTLGSFFAPTFASEEDAKHFFNDQQDYMETWDHWSHGGSAPLQAVEVEATCVVSSAEETARYASIADCRRAGLPGWMPYESEGIELSPVLLILADPEMGKMPVRELGDMPMDLDAMQDAVGGYIQYVPMPTEEGVSDTIDAHNLIVDEEGRLKGKPLNPIASSIAGQTIVGDALWIPADYSE
jgi:hypothetical protein